VQSRNSLLTTRTQLKFQWGSRTSMRDPWILSGLAGPPTSITCSGCGALIERRLSFIRRLASPSFITSAMGRLARPSVLEVQFLLCGAGRRSSEITLFIPSFFWLFVGPGSLSKRSCRNACFFLFAAQGCEVSALVLVTNHETGACCRSKMPKCKTFFWIRNSVQLHFRGHFPTER